MLCECQVSQVCRNSRKSGGSVLVVASIECEEKSTVQ